VLEGVLNERLRQRIEVGRGLVEDEDVLVGDRGVLELGGGGEGDAFV